MHRVIISVLQFRKEHQWAALNITTHFKVPKTMTREKI